ncbi:MAG: class I SAM-dependent methyltransferase [Candidatus Rokubacteria bacterium]|nr:class I SAM-dependent methyltransferase [Candidatus Rokubacteria bacterium]MBI3824396.1 class I SAM-dependent methyltransferase [Candidatus Rokubacteria bacterium]
MPRWRRLAVTVLVAGSLASRALAAAESPALGRFPAPDRPVATIISPAYSKEDLRDRRGEAERVMDRLGLRPGTRVADIGAGEGYYTVRLARRLGEGATVYAEDVSGEYLKSLAARLRREGLAHVKVIHGEPRDPKLPLAAVDVAILAHMYHEIENPYEFLYRLRPSLAAGARVAIVDVDKRTEKHGTPPALLRCELAAVGYREVDFIPLAPADGYLAVFVPPDTLPAPETIMPCAN